MARKAVKITKKKLKVKAKSKPKADNKEKRESNLPKEYRENGGPGRPKGSRNKFTRIKEIIADTFFDINGADLYKKKSKTRVGFRELMQDVVKLMPKETKLSAGETGDDDAGDTIIIIRPSKKEAPAAAPLKKMAKKKIAKKKGAKKSGRRIQLDS